MFKKILYIFLLSMVPVLELRFSIPFGAGLGIPFWACLPVSIVGNMIPVPFILIFIERIFAFMKRKNILPKLIHWLEEKAQKGAAKIEKRALTGLFLFVAIPLPGTGAWTGALAASLFHMNKKWAMLSIFAGVVAAGTVMTLASYGFVEFLAFLK